MFTPQIIPNVNVENIPFDGNESLATVVTVSEAEGLIDSPHFVHYRGFAILGTHAYFVHGAIVGDGDVVIAIRENSDPYKEPVGWSGWHEAENDLLTAQMELSRHIEATYNAAKSAMTIAYNGDRVPHRHGREATEWNEDMSAPTVSTFRERAEFMERASQDMLRCERIVDAKKIFKGEVSKLLNPSKE